MVSNDPRRPWLQKRFRFKIRFLPDDQYSCVFATPDAAEAGNKELPVNHGSSRMMQQVTRGWDACRGVQ